MLHACEGRIIAPITFSKTLAGVLPESPLKSPARWCFLQRASPPSSELNQKLTFSDSNYEPGGRCWRRPKTEPARQRRNAPATITESPIAARLPGLLGWLSATSAAVSELAQVGVGANRRGKLLPAPINQAPIDSNHPSATPVRRRLRLTPSRPNSAGPINANAPGTGTGLAPTSPVRTAQPNIFVILRSLYWAP